jgi:hypothetical protein
MENAFKVTVTIEKSLGEPEDYVVYCKSLELAMKSVQSFYDTTDKNYCKEDFVGFNANIERIDVITQ